MFFCGQHSRKNRKRQSCDTYEGVSSSVPKTLRKLQRKLKSTVLPKKSVDHLQCFQCLSKACMPCIRSVCLSMETNKDHSSDHWYQSVTKLMQGNQQSPLFIGHCCELKMTINNVKFQRESKRTNKRNCHLLYDGYHHISGIQVLIPPSIKEHIDVHGLGREKSEELPGLLHGVVNAENAALFYHMNLKSNGKSCNELPIR